MGLFQSEKDKSLNQSVVYYCLQMPNTYFLRFYSDGTVMYMGVQGDQTASMNSLVRYLTKEHTFYASRGKFVADGNKISFELVARQDGEIVQCEAELYANGNMHVSDHFVSRGKRRELVYTPVDDSAIEHHRNKSVSETQKEVDEYATFFDPRESTRKQLEKLIGKENLTGFDSEFLEDVDSALTDLIHDLLQIASKELNGFSLRPVAEDRIRYVETHSLLYDLNVALEASGHTRRFFYYWDNMDFGQDHGYFYTEKDTGMRIIQLLKAPPDLDFSGKKYTSNRVIEIILRDSTTHEEIKYFKQLILDF